MILGGGALGANSICPSLINVTYRYASGLVDFKGLFLLPCYIAAGAAAAIAIFFHPPKEVAVGDATGSAPH